METGYTAAYLTQGMPAEFDADKRIWLRVGVKAQNTTDEDITAYLTVENAEIRGRSSDENSPDSITFEAEILEIRDGYFLVKPEAGWAINSAALLEVPMENMEPSPALQVGDMIEITYDGRILETDPGRIHTVYRIRIAQEPDDPRAYESGGNVRERENAPDDMEWQDGISFPILPRAGRSYPRLRSLWRKTTRPYGSPSHGRETGRHWNTVSVPRTARRIFRRSKGAHPCC